MATIIINGIDFGGHVIAGTYAVQNNNIYAAWTDGNGSNHRQLKREKMQGSFDMFFRTMEEYETFMAAIKASQETNFNTYVSATLTDNLSNEDVESNYYFDYAPIRNRDADWRDYLEKFTVNVEEF